MAKRQTDKRPPQADGMGKFPGILPKVPAALKRPRRFTYDQRKSSQAATPTGDYLANANLFRRSYIKTIDEFDGQPVDSEIAWFVGNHFAYYKLSSRCHSEARRTLEDCKIDKIDGIVVDLVLSGQYVETTENGSFVFAPGDLVLTQTTIDVTAVVRKAEISSIFLPRAMLVAEIGSDLSDQSFNIRHLSGASLAPMAAAQMRELYHLYKAIPPEHFELGAEATILLLMEILREELAKNAAHAGMDDLLHAAMELIELRYRDPELSPEIIAQKLGISRSKLYKIFSDHSLTVASYLRDLRLRHFVDGLRETADANIGRLAWRCGFDMAAPEFAKLFKKAYGMRPSDAKAALREGRKIHPKRSGSA